jgi:hypothetical protein
MKREIRPEDGEEDRRLEELKRREGLWVQVLTFIVSEYFGEVPGMGTTIDFGPVAEGEVLLNVKLEEHEKRFYEVVDGLRKHLESTRRRMASGDLSERERVVHALIDLFWGLIKLDHPSLQDPDSIGIREGFKIVSSSRNAAEAKSSNLLRLLGL